MQTYSKQMASPQDPAMPNYQSLKVCESKQGFALLAAVLSLLIGTLVLLLLFVPWQQSVSGLGKIIIFSPMERPQNIEAQIPGRLKHWHVHEGQKVSKGQLIAELSDLDPKFLDPEQLERLKSQKKALSARKQAAELRYNSLKEQIESLKLSQKAAVPSANERARQAKDRIWSAEQGVEAARQNTHTTELNLSRLKDLYENGLRSKRDLELAELDHARAVTDLQRANAALEIAKKDQTLAHFDLDKVSADTDAAISNIYAAMAAAQETIESTSSEIIKLDIDIHNLSKRQDQRLVYAPRSGKIVRILKVGTGETVDAGMVLAVIAPETEDLAAELMISDNDAPLVAVGRPVRLQFAGWPALQFSGWPSIAVGTFAGRIAVIDAVDDGSRNYRVIVKPDAEAIARGRDEAWPSVTHLRPGAEASGWIMLDTVPLGFELWRQFNAFPPTVKPESLGLTKGSTDIGKSESKRKSK
ncbi:MAG: HlyD family secretion protein [Candidatus Obscuribacterales bacterium]|nr:HlyD family secretion protein [Candidatus Obscuribacterales bacterium]